MKSTVLLWFVTVISLLALVGVALSVDDWKSEDIGDTQAGSTDINGDVITIVANGADIWGVADAFRFVFREVSGDFEISAHCVSLERANEWSKVGLMVRQDLDPGSPNAFLKVTPDYGVKLIHRDVQGGTTGPTPWEKNFECPIWIKMVRKGNEISTFWSEDGVSWEPAEVPGTPSVVTMNFTDPVLVGIAVTSHVAGTLTEAVVENVQGSGNLMLPVEPGGNSIVTWSAIKTGL